MRRIFLVAALSLVAAFTSYRMAFADEQTQMLTVSGDWGAMAHRPSMMAPPDMCMAMNMAQKLVFRSDRDAVELRVINATWSLPPHVQGAISVKIGTWTKDLYISGNTDTMVAAEIPFDAILPMFDAMDKASTMSIVVGNANSHSISLAGSSKATNAFRTCAGIPSNDKKAGGNPFQ